MPYLSYNDELRTIQIYDGKVCNTGTFRCRNFILYL